MAAKSGATLKLATGNRSVRIFLHNRICKNRRSLSPRGERQTGRYLRALRAVIFEKIEGVAWQAWPKCAKSGWLASWVRLRRQRTRHIPTRRSAPTRPTGRVGPHSRLLGVGRRQPCGGCPSMPSPAFVMGLNGAQPPLPFPFEPQVDLAQDFAYGWRASAGTARQVPVASTD